jgi:outer membrane protein
MKRSLALAVTLASGFALCAAAQTSPAQAASTSAAQTKIAVVSFQVAVAQTNEGQRSFADLQKKFEPKRQQLKGRSEELDGLTKQLQTQGEKLSDSERASRARTIDEKKKHFDRDAEDAQNEFQQQMQELYSGLASKVYDVLSGYAQQQGYTLVLDVSQQQSPVLWAQQSSDITKQLIAAYNQKSGVPTPDQPAAKTPGAH